MRIHETLGQENGRRTVIVHGLGGMGKTQLTAAYAKRHRDDYSAILWLNARDEVLLKQSFAKAAERILYDHPSNIYMRNAVESRDLDEAVRAIRRWLDEPRNDRWLLIYDNYDDPELDGDEDGKPRNAEWGTGGNLGGGTSGKPGYNPNAFSIEPFLPDVYHGTVIVTTRLSQIPIDGQYVQLEKLKHVSDGVKILSYASGRSGLQNGRLY